MNYIRQLSTVLCLLFACCSNMFAADAYLGDIEMVVDDDGLVYRNHNVGVGFSQPSEALDVSGDVRFSGDLYWPDIGPISPFIVRATGATATQDPQIIVGSQIIVSGNPGSGLIFSLFSKATHALISSTFYATQTSSAASDSLATALDAIAEGQFAILMSSGSWTGALSANLRLAFQGKGLHKALVIPTTPSQPYAAIFEGGLSLHTLKATELISFNKEVANLVGFFMDESYVAEGSRTSALASEEVENEGMFVDVNGRVGIGVTSTGAFLDVNGNIRLRKVGGTSTIHFSPNFNDPGFISHREGPPNDSELWFAVSDNWAAGDTTDDIVFGDTNGVSRRFRFEGNGIGYSSISFNNGGADYAEWFEKEADSQIGDLIGINLDTGKVRPYQPGDKWIGIHSSQPGLVGNHFREEDADMAVDHTLVGLVGQLAFNPSQVAVTGRKVSTLDGVFVGVVLSDGKVYIK